MRKQEKIIIWPVYFDQAKTRKDGRRVAKSLALRHPMINEITTAVEKLGLKHEISAELVYPRMPWSKTGIILVEKQGSKEQVIKKIAIQLLKIRNEAPKK